MKVGAVAIPNASATTVAVALPLNVPPGPDDGALNTTFEPCGAWTFNARANVNPIVALFLGWLLLHEDITLRTILASAVILAAVLLVITAPHGKAAKSGTAVPSKVIEASEDPAF